MLPTKQPTMLRSQRRSTMRPELHALSLAEYQALALSDDGDFDAISTLEIGDAVISIGHHRDIGPCVIGCLGPDGGFVAELKQLPARRAGQQS